MPGDLDLDAVFGRSSPDDAFAAVLTEARMVLAEIASPLEAELWGSDILAALGGAQSTAAQAMVPAAERSGTPAHGRGAGCGPAGRPGGGRSAVGH
jgi:hypothetical protein